MTPQPRVGSSLTRRDLLKALGLAGSAAAAVPLLNACGVGGGGGPATQNGANEVSGGFDWKKAQGTSIKILQTPHPYQQSFQPLLAEFTALTESRCRRHVPRPTTSKAKTSSGKHRRPRLFITGAYFICSKGPPVGWGT